MKYCKKCDKYYVGDAFRCETCGEPLEEKDPVAKKPTIQKSKNKAGKVLICVVIWIATLLITSIITVALGGDRNPTIILAIEVIVLIKISKSILSDNEEEKQDSTIDYATTKDKVIDTINSDSSEIQYYYMKGTDIEGPCNAQQIIALNLEDDNLIMNNVDNKWIKYCDLKKSFNVIDKDQMYKYYGKL